MSLDERLRELENDVRDVKVAPAATVRARGRSRGRRQRVAVLAAGVAVAGTAFGGVAVGWPQEREPGPAAASPGITCDVTLPKSPADVRVRVVDGGAPAGVVEATIEQLRARQFDVVDGPVRKEPADAVLVSYGPSGVGGASLMKATLHDKAVLRMDVGRTDDIIDLVVAPGFTRLATATELNQNLVAAGLPAPPPECG